MEMRNLLCGSHIRLTAVNERDEETIASWFNDVQFLRYFDFLAAVPKRLSDIKSYLQRFSATDDRYLFAARLVETGEIIGILGFDDIVWSSRVATLFIGIGDGRHTARGYGKEALELLLDYGFNELNLFRIQLYVLAYNQVAIGLYESHGFVREGSLRQFLLRDGRRYDLHVYGLLYDDWQKQQAKKDAE